MKKVIIAGSRDFNNFSKLKSVCDFLLKDFKKVVIISGGAKGADQLGERYAELRGFKVKLYKADWKKYGKSAGIKRNAEMAEYADMLIAFWDGKSKGTANMISLAKKANIQVNIISI
ncbi:MAG: DUF2493 domain-containing protein [Flavobacteriales bacterium]|nr:DUF2493 domain-containing protein [Flavobacteriales bacterium]